MSLTVRAKSSGAGRKQGLAIVRLSADDTHARREFEEADRWANVADNRAYGLPYGDDLAGPGGIHATLYCNEQHVEDRDMLRKCLSAIRAKRDVVSHTIFVIPTEWKELNLEHPKT